MWSCRVFAHSACVARLACVYLHVMSQRRLPLPESCLFWGRLSCSLSLFGCLINWNWNWQSNWNWSASLRPSALAWRARRQSFSCVLTLLVVSVSNGREMHTPGAAALIKPHTVGRAGCTLLPHPFWKSPSGYSCAASRLLAQAHYDLLSKH